METFPSPGIYTAHVSLPADAGLIVDDALGRRGMDVHHFPYLSSSSPH